MRPALYIRPCYTLHCGLFSSTANGPLKLIRPEKLVSENSKVVLCTCHIIGPGCGRIRGGWPNGETVNRAMDCNPCRYLTINPFYAETQSNCEQYRNLDGTLSMNYTSKRVSLWLCALVFSIANPVLAVELLSNGSSISRQGREVIITLALSEPTPYQVFTLDNPRRLLVDFGQVGFSEFALGVGEETPEISDLRFGLFKINKTRVVLDLVAPLKVVSAFADLGENGGSSIIIRLEPALDTAFSALSRPNLDQEWSDSTAPVVSGALGGTIIAIDAGHGGLEFGAQLEGVFEKDIVLNMAQILKQTLLEDGRFQVVLTRESDVFVPLGERVERARRAGASAYISLHADVVTLGRARGTTVFSLSEAGLDQQAVTIATLENRSDLVAGISAVGEDDELTKIMLQMAHRETDALSNRFADIMAEALWFENELEIKSRRMAAGFRVLRAPDIPSVLVEIGFMSDKTDLENMQNPEWQQKMAVSILAGLSNWVEAEVEMRGLLRN